VTPEKEISGKHCTDSMIRPAPRDIHGMMNSKSVYKLYISIVYQSSNGIVDAVRYRSAI